VPKIKKAYTVSPKIANAYFERYGITMGVIRNVPYFNTNFTKKEVHFPTKNKVILYQGTITERRGIKQTIQSLKYLKNVDLVIIGYGKIKPEIVEFVNQEGMNNRVHFLGKIPFEILPNYTKLADVGIILEEPIGQSFQFSLPNKLFDYIHSELPILASPLDEVKKIIEKHNIGLVIENHDPQTIANCLNRLLQDENLCNEIIENQKAIKKEYCWEKESKLLDNYFN
jgi:glycosyltransferase involved in cell wall biosynthesis